ncbi:hypothetical protein AZI86_17055 [Bdellovibrio bacteriovorus]|uniref:HTH cro/C1-type domain-containing protein n=1 Tax=Bdellovibrio bacteriovorus TaxID=959 RepID=A0A150WEL8_BDEBC|nr:helix-turn-helix domain-containing protein [Bdellovibrio bacteriovorus]KYG61422.1 hypothetical protein AZI86_17055 [Bdellovibrio bacteriovorus]
MGWNENFIALLEEEFKKLKARNSRISMRGFARILGVSASTVFRVMSGDLQVSSERALQMVSKLNVEPDRLNDLIFLMNHPYKITKSDKVTDNHRFVFRGSKNEFELYRNELYGLLMRLKIQSVASAQDADFELKIDLLDPE